MKHGHNLGLDVCTYMQHLCIFNSNENLFGMNSKKPMCIQYNITYEIKIYIYVYVGINEVNHKTFYIST